MAVTQQLQALCFEALFLFTFFSLAKCKLAFPAPIHIPQLLVPYAIPSCFPFPGPLGRRYAQTRPGSAVLHSEGSGAAERRPRWACWGPSVRLGRGQAPTIRSGNNKDPLNPLCRIIPFKESIYKRWSNYDSLFIWPGV
jgi:hypothetical protein